MRSSTLRYSYSSLSLLSRNVYTNYSRFYTTGQVIVGKSLFLKDGSGKSINVDEIFKGKKVALVGLPGAFTPVCSSKHLPAFSDKEADLKKKGIDEIAFVMVNDSFVVQAFEKSSQAKGVKFYADWDGSFTRHIGMNIDLSVAGLGQRCKRFTAVVDNGKIVLENVEASPADFKVTTPEILLSQLATSK